MQQRTWAGVLLAVAAVVAVGLAANTGRSQPAPGGAHPVAVIDLVKIFSETAQIKDLNETMRQKSEDYSAELKKRGEALNSKKLELQAFKPGTNDYETRRKELMKMSADGQAWAKVTEDDLEQQKFDWTVEIYRIGVETAEKVAKARGFDVVVQRTEFKPQDIGDRSVGALRNFIQGRTVVYHVPEIDITDEVIRTMDGAYKAKAPVGGAAPKPAAPTGATKQ